MIYNNQLIFQISLFNLSENLELKKRWFILSQNYFFH